MDVICIAINDFMLLLLKGGKNIARCSVNPCIFNRAMNLTHHSTADVLHSHFSSLTFRLRLKGMGLKGVSSGIITEWTLTSCLSCYLSMWQSFPIKVSSSSSFFMKEFFVKITRLFGLWSIRRLDQNYHQSPLLGALSNTRERKGGHQMGIAQRLLTRTKIHVGNGDQCRQCEHWELDNDVRQRRRLRSGGKRSSCNLDVPKYYIFVLCFITFII